VTRRVALILTLAFAAAWGIAPRAATVPEARLTAITSHANATRDSLVIQANEPVAYTTTRPDGLTILVEFRNVAGGSVTRVPQPAEDSPIAGVSVEAAESLGVPVSRVRISLSRPVAHHVRSDRNRVIVDLEHGSIAPAAAQSSQAGVIAGPRIETPAVDPVAALGLAQGAPAPAANPLVADASARQGAAPAAILQPAALGQNAQSGTSGRTYSGTPVSLDFQQADLRAVLRVFSEISGLNIVIDPAVTGTVDVALRDVPWDQALDIILRANKLGYIVDGTIVRIAPLTVLAEEEAQRRQLETEQALAGDLQVVTKQLSYARAEQLAPLITKSALSQRGTVQVDARSNTLIITDLAESLDTASDLIAALDKAQPQVEIEARIVQTTKDYARALGVQWGVAGRVDPSLGNTTNMAFPNSGSLTGRTGTAQGPGAVPNGVDLGVTAASSALGLALGSVNGAFNLDVALSALERAGHGRLLSTPRVSTQNNIEAEIKQGVQIPIQTVSNNTVTVTFKDAALTLRVLPQITAAGTVIMKIGVENATADFSKQVNGIPPINTQSANTTVLVGDGQTTVIGGIYANSEQATNDQTPGLGKIPFLKWLFKRDTINDQSSELLIFITPRITKE
jgi:type IV pilus assembly protein PilQ